MCKKDEKGPDNLLIANIVPSSGLPILDWQWSHFVYSYVSYPQPNDKSQAIIHPLSNTPYVRFRVKAKNLCGWSPKAKIFQYTMVDCNSTPHRLELVSEGWESFEESIRIFPNPASSLQNQVVEWSEDDEEKILQYEVISIDGRRILSQEVDGYQIKIKGLTPGMYMLRLIGTKQQYVKRIIFN